MTASCYALRNLYVLQDTNIPSVAYKSTFHQTLLN